MSCTDCSPCEAFIRKLEMTLPELVTPTDLVKVGVYKSSQAAAMARQSGHGPGYFQLNAKRVLYPRGGVIEFLKTAMR